jgi:RNA polymerase sigma factor (sigma-70 family)
VIGAQVMRDAELYEKHADALVRFATGLVGPSDAADVVSDAVLRVVSSPAWASVRDPRAYLYRAVLNEAHSQYRSTMRRRARELRVAMRDRDVVPEPSLPRPEVLELVARLSVRQRAVVVLTYWDDLTPAGVANLLGISEGAVKRHLARAHHKLRELMNDE